MAVVYTDIYEQFNKSRVDKVADDSDYTGTAITSGNLIEDKRYTFISIGSGANFENLGSVATASLAIDQSFYSLLTDAPTAWGGASLYEALSPSDIIEVEIANAS